MRWSSATGSTLRIAVGATCWAVCLGVAVALAVRRSSGLWRWVLTAALPIPLLLPPAIVAIAWTHLLGKRGIAAQAWLALSGERELPFSIYNEAGAAWVLGLCWFPLVALTTLVGLRAVGASSLAAGSVHAGPWFRMWRIDLPLLLPYVSAGAAFVAWLALGDLDLPPVLLTFTTVNTLTLLIYGAIKTLEIGRALALCVPLLAFSIAVLVARQLLVRGVAVPTLDSRWRQERPEAQAPGTPPGGRVLQILVVAILGVAVLLPVLALAHQTAAWENVRAALETAGREILNSFQTAAVAALLLVALSAPYARLLTRQRGWPRLGLALLALLPLTIPPTLHGLAWTETLCQTAAGRALLASPFVISLAAAARFFPFGVFLLAAVFDGLAPQLLDAAKLSGAGAPLRWARIVFPLTGAGFLAAFAIAFAFSIGELSAATLLNPPGYSTLPVRISSLLHFNKDELLAALCLAQVFLALVPYLAAALFLERTLEVRLG